MMLMGLGDYIDANDPCTIDPTDPVCQANASLVAQDPCKVDPTQSFCQSSIMMSNPDPTATAYQVTHTMPSSSGSTVATVHTPVAAAAGLFGLTAVSWIGLAVVAVLSGGAYYGIRRYERKHGK